MSLPSVTVVCPNLSSNAAGRALLLAEVLASETNVRLVGVQRGPAVWAPILRSRIPVQAFPWPGRARFSRAAVGWLENTVRDDVLIVSKPLLHSLGLALVARRGSRRTIIDIDDWETGFAQLGASTAATPTSALAHRLWTYARRGGANAFVLTRLLEAYAARMPHRLVSNQWLERRFGGRIVYHVRDARALDPAQPRGHGPVLPRDRVWIGFIGTPRPHKGVHELIDALGLLQIESAPGLALMGVEAGDPEAGRAEQLLGSQRFCALPPFPFEDLAHHVRAVDIIAVPSLDVPASRGQIPAKVFDALAMAKPIVATAVNDLPAIVDGCGLVVPPGSVPLLAAALQTLAGDPALRERLGKAGRARFLERYSYDVARPVLVDAVRAAAAA